jgi:hypothetical protein
MGRSSRSEFSGTRIVSVAPEAIKALSSQINHPLSNSTNGIKSLEKLQKVYWSDFPPQRGAVKKFNAW